MYWRSFYKRYSLKETLIWMSAAFVTCSREKD
jgi:hypothetical protein